MLVRSKRGNCKVDEIAGYHQQALRKYRTTNQDFGTVDTVCAAFGEPTQQKRRTTVSLKIDEIMKLVARICYLLKTVTAHITSPHKTFL